LAPSDFFPCRPQIDQAADFRPNIELNHDVTPGQPGRARVLTCVP
jgi:hypothetical protein